jgi:hypothetical protein
MSAVTVHLEFPARQLSPNARGIWYTKESPRKAAKQAGCAAVREVYASPPVMRGPLAIHLTIHPPDGYRYDWDNLVGRLKYYQDGICEALRINDRQIKRATVEIGEVIKPGGVTVHLETISK